MLTRRTVALGALAGVSLAATGCEALLGYRIRYKSQLTVTTEAGHFVGTGVAETRIANTSDILSSFGGLSQQTKGQAAVIDLGGGQAVAALLRGYRYLDEDGRAIPDRQRWEGWLALLKFVDADWEWEGGKNAAFRRLSKLRRSPPVSVSGLALPMIAYFPDRLDPKSAVLLPPVGPPADTPLKSVSFAVQLTSDRLFMERPEAVFPWAVRPADEESTYLTRYAERLRTEFDIDRGDIIRRTAV